VSRAGCWTILLLAWVAALTAIGTAGDSLVPYLSAAHLAQLRTLLDADRSRANLEQEEVRYQNLVRKQTMADLALIYAPENLNRVQVAYVSFTPESAKQPGADLGYGLHIVKRLDVPLANGETRTIYVNEQWREERISKGLVLPDEIRIQTQVATGPRRVKDSDRLYVFDSIRIAWNAFNRDPQLARHTIYKWANGKNELKTVRTPVSAPFSCATCHGSTNRFADGFLARGETRNYEAIVQDRYFQLPPSEMRGYQEYVAYLERSNAPADMIRNVKAKLDTPLTASLISGLFELLASPAADEALAWLPEDPPLEVADVNAVRTRQGVYQDAHGRWRIDAIEDLIEGKYVWWEPLAILP
jgi:hypothetical protein